MADLDKKLHSALGKKGAATKKQVKAEESIAKQEADILAKRKQILSSGKEIQTHLNKQLAALKLTLAEQKLNYKQIMNDVRESTSAVKKVQGQIKKVKTAEIQAQKKQAQADAKAQKEKARWEQAKRGSYKESTKYGADGLAETSFRVSKAISNSKHMNMNAAEAAVQKEIRELRKKKNFVPGSEQYSINRGANGTWSFDLSASAKEQAPQKSVMSRAWDGVKLAVESIKEVIGKLLSALSKFLGGVGKVVKGLWKFGKNIAKIALGLPLFNALFAKLASLNGLNAFEFVGASTGAGNATTARNLKILEDMYGTDGSMSKIAGSRMDLLANPANLRFLQMIGMSDDEIKGKDANMFALSYAKKLSAWFQQQSGGMSLKEIAANPTDTRVRAAYSSYNATGMSNIMSLESLLGYDRAYQHGYDKELADLSQGKGVLYKAIDEQYELKAERGYQASVIQWQNMWIKLATKIQPYMSEISDGLCRLADGFIDLLFNNGGFQKMVNVFMSAFRKITAWLKSKEVTDNIEKALDWIGDKVKGAYSFLTEKQLNGKTGIEIIKEKILATWDIMKRAFDALVPVLEWIADFLGVGFMGQVKDKHGSKVRFFDEGTYLSANTRVAVKDGSLGDIINNRVADYHKAGFSLPDAQKAFEYFENKAINLGDDLNWDKNGKSHGIMMNLQALAQYIGEKQQQQTAVYVTVNVDKDGNTRSIQQETRAR